VITLKDALLRKAKQTITYRRPLSTGLATLNCALSGNRLGGVESGCVIWISGQSDSGRTIMGLTFLAEAVQNLLFDRYALFFHDTEGKQPDIQRLFGEQLYNRVKQLPDDMSVEDVWEFLASPRNSPYIYVLDSIDGLIDDDAWKVNNQRAKETFDYVRQTDSILVILSQQKLIDGKKVAAGGAAIPFYVDYIIHTANIADIFGTVNKKMHPIGIRTKFDIVKRKYVGKFQSIPVPIFFDHGLDNVDAICEFLLARGKATASPSGRYAFADMGWTGNGYNAFRKFVQEREVVLGCYIEHFR
jgi:RecA/RadA recombinase